MTHSRQPRDQSQRQSTRQRRYMELVDRILTAVSTGDRDTEMELRAEVITRFRLSHERIDAELYRQLTRRLCGDDDSPLQPCGEHDLDMGQVTELSWLVRGYIPNHDQTLIYGAAGSGKTLAAIRLAFAVIDGTGFLDHPDPPANLNGGGRVLFIGSDSGAEPIKQAISDLDLADHPALYGPDKQFFTWAGHAAQGTVNWTASIPDWLRLLRTVQERQIDLVIVDSAKAVTAQSGLEYTDNGAVGAMLAFTKQALTPCCSLVWLHHDGVLKGAHAGAKAWAEIPSVVHRIDKPDRPDQPRSWTVVKTRKGDERSFRYRLLDGQFSVCDGATAAVPADAAAAVIQALSDALQNGQDRLSRVELVNTLRDRFGIASKTVDNTLTRLCKESPPRVCRITKGKGNRGFYRLSPRLQEQVERNAAESSSPQPDASNSLARARMGVHMKWEGKGLNSSSSNGFDLFPTSSLGKSDKFPREKPGKSQESSPGQGSAAFPSHMDAHHARARVADTPTSNPPVTSSSDPSAAGSAAASRPAGRSDAGSAEPQILPGTPSGASEEPRPPLTTSAGLAAAADAVAAESPDTPQADGQNAAADSLDPDHPWNQLRQHADDLSDREDQVAAPPSAWARHSRNISVRTRSVPVVHDLELLLQAADGQADLLQSLDRRIEEIVSGDQPSAGGVSSGGQDSGNQDPEPPADGASSRPRPSAGSGDDSGNSSGDQDHGSAAGGASPQPKPSAGDSGNSSGNSSSSSQDPEPPAGGVSGSSGHETNGSTASAGDQPSAGPVSTESSTAHPGRHADSRSADAPVGALSCAEKQQPGPDAPSAPLPVRPGNSHADDQPSGFEPWQEQLLELKRQRPQTPAGMLLPQLTVEPPTLDQAAAFLASPEADAWMRQAACSPPSPHPLADGLEPWQAEALRQRQQHPGDHPFSLLLKLDPRVSAGVDGRRLARFLADYDQFQEQRRREEQDL